LHRQKARVSKGYQDEVVRATDGAQSATKTKLYNQLRGTTGWPAEFSPRGIKNKNWYDHQAGVPFEELKKRHDEALELGDEGWGPEGRLATYAGASVGLVDSVEDAGVLVQRLQNEVRGIVKNLNYEALTTHPCNMKGMPIRWDLEWAPVTEE
jgi:nitronate monooxygenase